MAKNSISKISNAFSTGGGGVNFEQQIQAMFLLSLLVEGFCPAMNEQTKRVCFQAKHLGYDVDDLVVFTYRDQTEGKMLCQIKHSITVTEKDKIFQEVICAAWSDFNKEEFDKENDRIALVTSQISNNAQQSLRFLHAQAIGSVDERDFIERINMRNFSNTDYIKMLTIIKECISAAQDCEPTNREIWSFCKAFILLLFDMDCLESVNRALSASLIKCNSSMDATLVWSRLVEYAGSCNQSAASINKENSDKSIQELFSENKIIQILPTPITGIDLFIPTVALIGTWREDNEFDRKVVERVSGIKYSEFEAKARTMLSQNAEYIQLTNGKWKINHKEELLDQCKEKIFDDSIERMLETVKSILSQKSKCVTSEMPYFVPASGEYENTPELRTGLVKSLCWIKKNFSELSQCNYDNFERDTFCLVRILLENAEWNMWASLRDCLHNLAELSPKAFLDSVERKLTYESTDILRLFPKKGGEVLGEPNYISELLWSLEILAWSPEYLVRSISVLGMLEALPYERTNWSNIPINSIVSILLPWHPQTMADLDKRKNALKCLKNDNSTVFWNALKKLLPNNTRFTTDNPKPQYLTIYIPEEVKVTNKEVHECYNYLLELAVDTAHNEIEKMIDLVDQIEYMYEPTLTNYLDCIESNFEFSNEEELFPLWLKLQEHMIHVELSEGKVIYNQVDRIQHLIEKLEPQDIRLKYQELYLGNRDLVDIENYEDNWERLENEKVSAVKEIFNKYGIEGVECFGNAVEKMYDVAYKLGQVLTQNEISVSIEKCSSGTVTREFMVNCLMAFTYTQGTNKLLETSLCHMEESFVVDILSKIPFSLSLFEVVNQILDDDSVYWEKVTMPYGYRKENAKELKIVIEKLIACRRYVTAINIIGHSEFESIADAECVYNLLKLAGTEESVGKESLDDYAVQRIIGWLQQQKGIDLELRSDIEFIYLPILNDYSEVQPLALRTRLSLEPEYFCSMIELFYKKRNDKKRKRELNKGLGDRLCKILVQFKITPGTDEDGNFDEEKFDFWMKTVKTWSQEQDRYEVTMHTVGSGLSYAPLDENKLPAKAIINELNKVKNSELRRGYYLGIINQRGVHFIDSEGKPEFELSEDYANRANIVEAMGYARYAEVLREIAEQYNREARRNISEAQNEKDNI